LTIHPPTQLTDQPHAYTRTYPPTHPHPPPTGPPEAPPRHRAGRAPHRACQRRLPPGPRHRHHIRQRPRHRPRREGLLHRLHRHPAAAQRAGVLGHLQVRCGLVGGRGCEARGGLKNRTQLASSSACLSLPPLPLSTIQPNRTKSNRTKPMNPPTPPTQTAHQGVAAGPGPGRPRRPPAGVRPRRPRHHGAGKGLLLRQRGGAVGGRVLLDDGGDEQAPGGQVLDRGAKGRGRGVEVELRLGCVVVGLGWVGLNWVGLGHLGV